MEKKFAIHCSSEMVVTTWTNDQKTYAINLYMY